jgi:hypothetical protein
MGFSFLPQTRFWGISGQNGDLFFTVNSFFRLKWAKWGPLFYRKLVFGALAGKMGTSFLPQTRFWGISGHNGDLFFTVNSFFGLKRA